jgi:hypothetical protein
MDDEIYYLVNEYSDCLTPCKLVDDVMVGSLTCHDCENCTDYDNNEEWIKCKMSADAK